MKRVILGTRGSDLARAQASMVEAHLRAAHPELEIVTEIIRTSGDEKPGKDAPIEDRHAGRKGMFTAEIESLLFDGRIDVAVHSAKDLPSEKTPGLTVCAALARAGIEDVLITKNAGSLAELVRGGVVATGSVRRQHQLRRVRPDLEVIDLRGNVPTRLRKLTANPWAGIILARAGLERLGYDCALGGLEFEGHALRTAILPTTDFLPAGGQGIVALEARGDDERTVALLRSINHAETFRCLRAEREFLRLLQGDCGTPVGVIAQSVEGILQMRAQLFTEEQVEPRTATVESSDAEEKPEVLAARLWDLIHG